MAEAMGVDANNDDSWNGEKLERLTSDDNGEEEDWDADALPAVSEEACETSFSDPM